MRLTALSSCADRASGSPAGGSAAGVEKRTFVPGRVANGPGKVVALQLLAGEGSQQLHRAGPRSAVAARLGPER